MRAFGFSLLAFLLICVPAAGSEAVVQTLAEKTIKGELVKLDEKELVLRVGDQEQKLPMAEVVGVNLAANSRPVPAQVPYLVLRMVDGSQFTCQAVSIKGRQNNNVKFRLFNGLELATPLRDVRWILCDAQDAKHRAAFEELLAKENVEDVVQLTSQTGVGTVDIDGFVHGANAAGDQLEVRYDNQNIGVSMNRVKFILLAKDPIRKVPTPVCWLKDNQENLIAAAAIESTQKGYKVKTVSGIEFELPRDFAVHFNYSPGKIAWLSDLQPTKIQIDPILSGINFYRRDRNLEGGPISIGRKPFAKGLATHSKTVLEYDVAGYNWFRCWVGIEDIVTGPADAEVEIAADGVVLFVGNVTNRDKPRELKLQIKDKRTLRITVNYGKDLDLGDHVSFGDARITK